MRHLLVLPTALLLGGLAACSAAPAPGPTTGGAPVAVVASTDVYGDVVRAVGGDAVSVTSIIDGPAQDPHEYVADARTQLALSKAQLVVENGAGYDDFVGTMLDGLTARPRVVEAATLSGRHPQAADGDLDEHLWYDVATMIGLTAALGEQLSALAPDRAPTIRADAAAFITRLRGLERTEATLRRQHDGTGVAVTEPVALHLLRACGLENRTPAAFSEAVEEGTDVPPAVLRETTALFGGHQVGLLAYNAQTAGPQTQAVLDAAHDNAVPVVAVTETLPAGLDYVGWMQGTLDAVGAALRG